MRNFVLAALFLSIQLSLMAMPAVNFKYNSQAFCDVVRHNNLDSLLDKQFIFDCAKLLAMITEMVNSLDDIIAIQMDLDSCVSIQQNAIINRHVLDLTAIRQSLLRIKNKYALS